MPHVVCPQVIHPDALALLRGAPGVTVEILPDRSPATLAARLPEADALIMRTYRVDRDFLAMCPKLRILARHGVGYDIIDVPALTERGIPLTITPEANAVSVAEHALMMMLACMRRLTGYDANMRRPLWGAQADLPAFDLAGKTVLVIGFGRIGTRVSRLCAAFGMHVLVRDPNVAKGTIRGLGYEPVDDAADASARADIVTLHCPSSAATRGMVDAGFLAGMKRGAVLVNTARGTLVDQAALDAALRGGHLAAAGLDVFEEEPIEAPIPLLSAPNLILTPHVAASTQEGLRRMAMDSAAAVLACFEGRLDPDIVVNAEVLGRNTP
jgi:D-3-phosphoglycerate dehydrogenase